MAPKFKDEKIAIIGSGEIARSWATIFVSAGYRVVLYDIIVQQISEAIDDIASRLEVFEMNGILRGNLDAYEQYCCVCGTSNLEIAVKDAIFVQECVSDVLALKRHIFRSVDYYVSDKTILSTASGGILPSLISARLKHKSQFVVTHSLGNCYFVPAVEIVPAPWTNKEVPRKTRELMIEVGQEPITLHREVEGFALNRIQYAILNEVWRMVENKTVEAEEVDNAISEGLGMRYAFLGPLEIAHLSANGLKDYIEKYGLYVHSFCKLYEKTSYMIDSITVRKVCYQLESLVSIDKIQKRTQWRDHCLMKLAKLKKEMKSKYRQN